MVAITILGEVVLDCVMSDGAMQKVPGGCAANQALALARFGAQVDLRARYSVDENGQFLKSFIASQGVSVANSIDATQPALVITITKDETGHPTFNYGELLSCADWHWTADEISLPLPKNCDGIMTGSMASVFPPGAQVLLDWATQKKEQGLPIFYDLNVRSGAFAELDEAKLRLTYSTWIDIATVIKVSDEDLLWWAPGATATQAAKELSLRGPDLVALTQGASGVTIFASGENLFSIAAPKIKVSDTVGAGDTFFGWLAGGLLELPPELRNDRTLLYSVVHDAVFASAYNCTQAGCNPPTAQQLAEFIA